MLPKLPYVSGVGGLNAFNNYWSSSQNNASFAWLQLVGGGGGSGWQIPDNKSRPNRVRPVRAF